MQPVACKCHYQCMVYFTTESRQQIFDTYWNLNFGGKRHFIDQSVIEQNVRRQMFNNPNRSITYKYCLEGRRVCKQFFFKTLNITERTVYYTKRKASAGHNVLTDRRGGARTAFITDVTKDLIRRHIESFPKMESHYVRESSSRQYLNSELSMNKMYSLFCKQHPDVIVKSSAYFLSYNLSFHRPKKDQCALCTKYFGVIDLSNEI